MTIVEVCIALALIAGLFTWLSSAATIGLTIAFCLSGMFYWVNIWFIFVAFAFDERFRPCCRFRPLGNSMDSTQTW